MHTCKTTVQYQTLFIALLLISMQNLTGPPYFKSECCYIENYKKLIQRKIQTCTLSNIKKIYFIQCITMFIGVLQYLYLKISFNSSLASHHKTIVVWFLATPMLVMNQLLAILPNNKAQR